MGVHMCIFSNPYLRLVLGCNSKSVCACCRHLSSSRGPECVHPCVLQQMSSVQMECGDPCLSCPCSRLHLLQLASCVALPHSCHHPMHQQFHQAPATYRKREMPSDTRPTP